MKKWIVVIAALIMLFQGTSGAQERSIKLASTTSTDNTGLFDYILPEFKKDSGIDVYVIAVGTGKALKLGENGDVDVLLVHAKPAELKFIADGYGVERIEIMYNDFVILGPKNDPALVKESVNVIDAFVRIANAQEQFISRGDDSGTHKKEKSYWTEAEITPQGAWYREAGQGMAGTLKIAEEKQSYVLCDRATYLASKNNITIDIVFEKDPKMFNQYSAIAINPETHPYVKIDEANQFIQWLASKKAQDMIGSFKKFDEVLFKPNAKK